MAWTVRSKAESDQVELRADKEKAEAEVAEEHVPVPVEVGECTLINWEHFSLAYEEYCLTKEVKKNM